MWLYFDYYGYYMMTFKSTSDSYFNYFRGDPVGQNIYLLKAKAVLCPGLTIDFHYEKKKEKIKWFYDGTLNASANCIDRHLKDKKDKTAIIWVGDDPKVQKKISYKQLHQEVSKAANGLRKLGIKKGDHNIFLSINL